MGKQALKMLSTIKKFFTSQKRVKKRYLVHSKSMNMTFQMCYIIQGKYTVVIMKTCSAKEEYWL